MKKYLCITALALLLLITMKLSMYSKDKNLINTVTIGFMGDIMIGRMVNEIIPIKGYLYPWGNTLPLLQHVDLRIINLETTLTTNEEKNPKVFNFKALPDRVKTLQAAHIDVTNLANNHTLDFKDAGLIETIATLDAASISHCGAGLNAREAQRPLILTKNNIKIGIIGYTDNEPTWKAENNKPGINYIRVGDVHTITTQIAALRPKVDILIITCHWGPNMQQRPSDAFVQFAHDIIDAGADIIHGHSSHVFQGIEIYKNKVIMYDTGDFIDDYAVDPALRNDQSCFFAVTVDKNGPTSIAITPVIIADMQVNLAVDAEKKEIMNRMQQLSQEFGTTISDDGVIRIAP
jgi:poly-gamma-glutamate capsule biosynthesis protein CapA/YwtB (metallophosphatase superfamily)